MKKKYIPKTALVACSRLVDFAGAEIASIEIAEALRDLGVQVKLAALEVGKVIESEIKHLGIDCIDLSASRISGEQFDLVWVSHYVTAYHLFIKEAVFARVGIFSSLSHFEPIETPPLPSVYFSRYTVNSEENLSHFETRYPKFNDRVDVFPNSAPSKFFDAYSKYFEREIKSVAIVSNHPPREIIDLIPILKSKEVRVDLIGVQGEHLRVTPSILSKYSVVITIGKTVQYCLALGVPVFCYDHYGGPGWITLQKFEPALAKNFSGRCSNRRLSCEHICSELFSGFIDILDQREALRDLAKIKFDLTKNLIGLLDVASEYPFSISLSETERQVLSRESSLFLIQRQIISNIQYALSGRDGQIACLNDALAERDAQTAGLNEALGERDAQIACLNDALAERDAQTAGLNDALVELEGQIASLNHALVEREEALSRSRVELTNVLMSSSWKITLPLRKLIINWRVLKARSRVLLEHSIFVVRQEGISGFFRRTIGFLDRTWQRKLAARQVERFSADLETATQSKNFLLVSFVIPIYDRTDVLRTAIESALNQSQQVFEVILVTDGSPPETLAVVEEFRADPRVRIFNYPTSSGNAVRGRNKGILEARGRYIAFLDSDDVATPDRLEVCLPILEAGKADVVYGAWRAQLDGTREIDGLVQGQEVHSPDCDLAMLEKICVPCQSTVMVRREILLQAGFLKPRMQYREDHELWVRLAYYGAVFKSVPHVLTDLRLHAGNNEINFKGNDSHWESLLREEYRLPGPIPKKIGFILAGLGISGGAAVVLKHISLLMEAGHDAFVIDLGGYGDILWYGNPAIRVYRMDEMQSCGLDNIDLLFATFWETVSWLDKIPARRKLYFVQSDERLFYESDSVKEKVAETYRMDYEYVVIARWLVDMLRNEFGKSAVYVPNGLDRELFYPGDPLEEKPSQRLRVLIEGPISVPFKGMADAYAAVCGLDCELWIVSTDGKPESGWRYDRFFEAVKQAEMRRIYSSCDVLLKMSRVESFAYPPLEAMACGCAVVLGEVDGGIEYAVDEVNVLKVAQGDVAAAREAVLRLLTDSELKERLILAGFETVKCWSWEAAHEAMLALIQKSDRS
ncbi:glycosyltransferase [Zoogloea sp.]|uniref:glycosyltransferase n=1 Tax=Zoogloea sp. TaxID=49181 RepID=UPI0035AD8EC0